MRHGFSLTVLLLLLATSGARASDVDPFIGYAFATYSLPFEASVSSSKPDLLSSDPWTSQRSFGRTSSLVSLGSFGVGAGIGYDGMNVQFDLRRLDQATQGALTFGYRLRLQLGRFETWARLAAGPSLLVDFDSSTPATGALQAVAEAGLDWFLVRDRMALGLKAATLPTFTWPATFDFGVNALFGLRFIL